MTPLSTKLRFNVRKVSKMANVIFYESYLNLGLYVINLLENCSIFGTTIFLDRRENAPIGENVFFLNYSVIFSVLFENFLNIEV